MIVRNVLILTDAESSNDRFTLAQSEIKRTCKTIDKAWDEHKIVNDRAQRLLKMLSGYSPMADHDEVYRLVQRMRGYSAIIEEETKINDQCWNVVQEVTGSN